MLNAASRPAIRQEEAVRNRRFVTMLLAIWFAAGTTGSLAQVAKQVAKVETEADSATQVLNKLPNKMACQALQTAGLHDYAGEPEDYEPSTFIESKFELRINRVLTRHLSAKTTGPAEAIPDLFLTMRPKTGASVELRCRQVLGLGGELGFSCTNTPPSELLLINPATLRFTRTSIGGWTFADNTDPETPANLGDDSLFVEYGTCE